MSAYVLVALGRDRRALLAAYQYLVLGTIGATFYVIGVGLLYLMTGTLNLAELALRVPRLGGPEAAVLQAAGYRVHLARPHDGWWAALADRLKLEVGWHTRQSVSTVLFKWQFTQAVSGAGFVAKSWTWWRFATLGPWQARQSAAASSVHT